MEYKGVPTRYCYSGTWMLFWFIFKICLKLLTFRIIYYLIYCTNHRDTYNQSLWTLGPILLEEVLLELENILLIDGTQWLVGDLIIRHDEYKYCFYLVTYKMLHGCDGTSRQFGSITSITERNTPPILTIPGIRTYSGCGMSRLLLAPTHRYVTIIQKDI